MLWFWKQSAKFVVGKITNISKYEKTITSFGNGRNDFYRLYAGWRTR